MKPEVENKLSVDDIAGRLGLPEVAMLARVEAALINGARAYCNSRSYQEIPIPHITRATGACENFSTLFRTDMFTQAAYLNQTGQLLLEAFMDRFQKTFCVGPSFRKENKADPRHLAEFNLFEIEVAGMDLEALQLEISGIVASMITNVKRECWDDMKELMGMDTNELISYFEDIRPPKTSAGFGKYDSITYRQALELLSEYNLEFGDDLKADHEQALVERTGGKPVFITHYPKEIKFFNMRENREDSTVVNSMDLLMPISGEAVGAAEREEDYKRLTQRLAESDMLQLLKQAIKKEYGFEGYSDQKLHDEAMSRFQWYMEVIKKHPVEHSGCGIGVSRIAQSLLQTKDIRKAVAFPINRDTLF